MHFFLDASSSSFFFLVGSELDQCSPLFFSVSVSLLSL